MIRFLFVAGSCGMALAVAGGAFGAHALRGSLPAPSLDLWATACRYLAIASTGVLVSSLAAAIRPSRAWLRSALALAAGGTVFASTVAALALGGPRWLGAVTPIGGALMIAGFVAMGVAGARAFAGFDTSRDPV